MLLLTIGYGAGAIAGENEDDTLDLIVVLPLPGGASSPEKYRR